VLISVCSRHGTIKAAKAGFSNPKNYRLSFGFL
jgi:hypothetical protein